MIPHIQKLGLRSLIVDLQEKYYLGLSEIEDSFKRCAVTFGVTTFIPDFITVMCRCS